MAIRKFRKMMKPVTMLVAVAMIGSGAFLTLQNLLQHKNQGATQYAFKLNGEKVSKVKIAQQENALLESLTQAGKQSSDLNKEDLQLLAFQKSINDALALQLAKDLKIKVSGSEVDEEYKKIEESIGNKEQFKRMLSVQGYSKASFKAMLEENILLQKTLEKFEEEAQKTGSTGMFLFQEALAKKRANMKMEQLAPEYEKLQIQTVEEKDGFRITNLDLAQGKTQMMLMLGITEEEAKNYTLHQYYDEIQFANKAKAEGIEVSEDLPLSLQLEQYGKKLFDKYQAEVEVSPEALEKYFTKHREEYNQKASVDVDIAVLKLTASKEDIAKIEKEAAELLPKLTKENFKAKGMELSQQQAPKVIYEELGWFQKGAMVKEFEEAAFSAKGPEIYSKVVSTNFGKHLLYIEEVKEDKVKASHILFREIPSPETVQKSIEEAQALAKKLEAKEVKFDSLKSKEEKVLFSHNFSNVDISGVALGFMNEPKFVKALYAADLNKVQTYTDEAVLQNGVIYLFEKTKQQEDKIVDFQEVAAEVEKNYRAAKAQEKFETLFKK